MGLCLGGLIIGRIFASEIWGMGGAYFREGLLFFGGGALLLEFYGNWSGKFNFGQGKVREF